MAPRWALYPMVALATTATIIASQAVISGAYSLTLQAMQLGYAPRMEVQHTSSRERGQIYIPALNWTLLLAVIALVMGFGSSTNLAAAYGVAVTGTMIITTVLAFVVVRDLWGWGPWKSVPVLGAFLLIDAAFFSANLVKIEDGGWFPLAFGAGMFLFMTTWKRGRDLLHARLETDALPLADFVAGVSQGDVARIPGTAVFLTATPAVVPHALLHSLKHYRCLHERVVILTVVTRDEPYVPDSERIVIEPVNAQFCRLRVSFGFMEEPDIPKALELAGAQGLEFDPMQTSFFLGRETLIPKLHSEMAYWRERLFVAMYRNSGSAVAYFRLPSNRVVELGTQIVL
jgi:KUP system potassium uptake protein